MSHIETVNVTLTDLKALKAACDRLGVEFRENQTTFANYYAHDAAKRACVHAIHVPGCAYEVGLRAVKGTKSFEPVYDHWGPGGAGIQKTLCAQDPSGPNGHSIKLEKLVKAYSIEVIKAKARSQGYTLTERINAAGKTQLFATVR
jgi:hypothetical protein